MSGLDEAATRMEGGVQRYLDAPDHGQWKSTKGARDRAAAGAGNAARDAWVIATEGAEAPRWVAARTARDAAGWLADGAEPAAVIRAGLAVPSIAQAHRRAYARAHAGGRYPDQETSGTAAMQGASLVAQGVPLDEVLEAASSAGGRVSPFVVSAYQRAQEEHSTSIAATAERAQQLLRDDQARRAAAGLPPKSWSEIVQGCASAQAAIRLLTEQRHGDEEAALPFGMLTPTHRFQGQSWMDDEDAA